jgi:uncharacterized membrane protein
MKTEEKVLTYFLLIIVVLMIFFTFGLHRPGSKVVPLLIGFITLILMILLGIMTVSPKFSNWYQRLEGKSTSMAEIAQRSDEAEQDTDQKTFRKKEIAIVGWLLFLTAATCILGFVVAIPLFLFLFLKIGAREGWALSLIMSGVVLGVVYFIFVEILQIPLHTGIFLG